jgi:hypothetical protein
VHYIAQELKTLLGHKDLKAENKKNNNELKELKKGNNMVKYGNIWRHVHN